MHDNTTFVLLVEPRLYHQPDMTVGGIVLGHVLFCLFCFVMSGVAGLYAFRNLNVIERLWKFFKKEILYNTYYEQFEDFVLACQGFFRSRKKYAAKLRPLPEGEGAT